jgi:hypothetical protein
MGFNQKKEEKNVKKKKKENKKTRGDRRRSGRRNLLERVTERDGSGFQRVCGFSACGGFRPVNLPKMVKRLGKARDARDGRRRLGWPKRSAWVGFTWVATGDVPPVMCLFFFFFFFFFFSSGDVPLFLKKKRKRKRKNKTIKICDVSLATSGGKK